MKKKTTPVFRTLIFWFCNRLKVSNLILRHFEMGYCNAYFGGCLSERIRVERAL